MIALGLLLMLLGVDGDPNSNLANSVSAVRTTAGGYELCLKDSLEQEMKRHVADAQLRPRLWNAPLRELSEELLAAARRACTAERARIDASALAIPRLLNPGMDERQLRAAFGSEIDRVVATSEGDAPDFLNRVLTRLRSGSVDASD